MALGGWICLLIFLFVPLPIFNWRGRLFGMKLTLLMLVSPCYGTNFQIHWFTEQFISFRLPFQDFVYIIFFYTNEKSDNQLAITTATFILIFFFLLRIVQLFRQRYQSGNEFCTNFVCAIVKCSLNICTTLGSFFYNVYKSKYTLAIWIVLAVISTTYTFLFDLKIDWNLLSFQGRHKLLRPLRIIGHPAIYYVVIILNLFLRITWAFTISS